MMSVAGDREDGDEAVNRSAILGDITAGQAVPDGNSWSSAGGVGWLEGLVVITGHNTNIPLYSRVKNYLEKTEDREGESEASLQRRHNLLK